MKFYGDDKHLLFTEGRYSTQQNLRQHTLDLAGALPGSPKVIIQRKGIRSPTTISAKRFFGCRKVVSKSPVTYNFRFPDRSSSFLSSKNHISTMLLDGIEEDVKTRPTFRNFRLGKLRNTSVSRKNTSNGLLRACLFDTTVPDSIIIFSQTPVAKRNKSKTLKFSK